MEFESAGKMTKKMKVLVLFGGRSGEHDVSLMSSRSVMDAIDRRKYDVVPVAITREGKWLAGENVHAALVSGNVNDLFPVALLPVPGDNRLYAIRPGPGGTRLEEYSRVDVVIPVLHGTFGEDGTLQGLLEMADLAYVGAGVLGSSVGMDKGVFKSIMRAHGIPTPASVTFTRTQIHQGIENIIQACEELSAYPLFVKPANLGSSVGITKCRNRSDLYEGLMDASRFDRRILVEQGINAREIEVSVLGNDEPIASLPGEIRPREEFYSYEAKYVDESTELLVPAILDDATIDRVQKIALQVYKAIDCSGMGRVDFLLDRDSGELYVSEINTIPGFTQISMYPKLWEISGIPYSQLIDRLIELALERKADRDKTERTYRRAG